MKNIVEMASGSMIYIPRFMTMGSGILIIPPQQFDITDERDLRCTSLEWPQPHHICITNSSNCKLLSQKAERLQ
jgi:hypothetical protein